MYSQLEVIKKASTLIEEKNYIQAKKILLSFFENSKNVKLDIKFYYTLYLVSDGLKETQNAKNILKNVLE